MKKNGPQLLVYGIVLLSFFAAMSCATVTQDEPEAPSMSHNEMLEDLGIKTDLGAPKDPNGDLLPAEYNPLGKKYGVFNPTYEIYAAGFEYEIPSILITPVYIHQGLYDYSNQGLMNLHHSSSESWTSAQFKNCTGADVDGDGFEEVVVVYYDDSADTLNLKVIDNSGGIYEEYDKTIVTGVTSVPALPHYQPALAAGDFDGDDRDEIFVGFTHHVYMLEDMGSDYAVTISPSDYSSTTDLYLATGDLDWDSKDELVVTCHAGGYAYCEVYDGDLSSPFFLSGALNNTFSDGIHSRTVWYEQHVHVCVGDIDGDPYEEIVLHGECRDFGPGWLVTALKYDPGAEDFYWMDFYFFTFQSGLAGPSSHQPTLAVLDYDGDGRNEIFASLNLYTINPAATTDSWFYHSETMKYIFGTAPVNVWTGDVDGDRRDELVYFYNSALWVGGWDDDTSAHVTQLTESGACSNWSTLCLANVDDDSPIVEYTGQRELLFSDPTVIAVLACPPYHGGTGQNVAGCGTTFGRSTASGVEETESTGFSVGFSVGYEYEDPFGISKSSFKMSVESAMDWISSRSHEVEKYIAYSSGPDEDKVIFTAVPFDVYYYTVVSSSKPGEVGNTLSINVPREMQTLSVSRTFYNEKNGENPDIGAQVLGHSIGSVLSYPDPAERNALLAGCTPDGLWSDDATVGVGNGYQTIGIRISQGQGTGTYNDFSTTIESEIGVGGVTFGMSAGFHYGFEYMVTNTESTFYEGKVGDIPYGSYTSGMFYMFGLFTYPCTLDEQNFTVVNYWVD